MAKISNFSRRKFIGTTSAAVGGLMLPGYNTLGDYHATKPDDPSTPHFWYRNPPKSPYVDYQHKNMAFAFTDTEILFSDDNSHTWRYKTTFPNAKNINYSHIFKDGTILFGTPTKLFLWNKGSKSYKEIIVKDTDGSDYIPHTPKNPVNPGWYFHTLQSVDSWEIDNKEMLVWGNCPNVKGGAAPSNIYYSVDSGKTVKIAYSFGQNPYHRDNGSSMGGQDGKFLGNPENPVICRHIHWVSYNPDEDAFYACTGDGNKPKGMECHWLRGTYDSADDKWHWNVIVTAGLNSRWKSGGINFVDGQMYWVSDANGPEPYDRGIFRCDPANIGNPIAHTMLYDPEYPTAAMLIEDGVILASYIAKESPYMLGIIYSPDLGKSWFVYDIKEYGPVSGIRIHKKNAEGWFRFDLRTGWIDRGEFLFLKPKPV